MTQDDIFRRRILNWARYYESRPRQGESNLMPIIRLLRMIHGVRDEGQPQQSTYVVTDPKDAELLEKAFCRLRRDDKKILFDYYIKHKTINRVARQNHLRFRDCISTLDRAERHWRNLLDK